MNVSGRGRRAARPLAPAHELGGPVEGLGGGLLDVEHAVAELGRVGGANGEVNDAELGVARRLRLGAGGVKKA